MPQSQRKADHQAQLQAVYDDVFNGLQPQMPDLDEDGFPKSIRDVPKTNPEQVWDDAPCYKWTT